jgi:hypothetical protein
MEIHRHASLYKQIAPYMHPDLKRIYFFSFIGKMIQEITLQNDFLEYVIQRLFKSATNCRIKSPELDFATKS